MEFRAQQEEVKQEEPEGVLQGQRMPQGPGDVDMDSDKFKDITPNLKRGPGRKKKDDPKDL